MLRTTGTLRKSARRLLITAGGGLLVMAGFNLYAQRVQTALPPRLPVDGATYTWRGHTIAYTAQGTGAPLLLVHSINGAASSFELRKQWAGLAAGRRLYALDLLGFGGSDRPAIAYSAALYTDLITDFVRDIIGQPTAVLSSSMSGSFVIAAAARDPRLFTRLLLIEPTGTVALATPQGRAGRAVERIIRSPFVGTFLFNLLVSGPGIRYFLADQTYHDAALATPAVLRQSYQTSHRPGARYGPAAFVTGALNSDVASRFAALPQPVLIAWGTYAKPTPVGQAQSWTTLNPRARLVIFERSGILPHDEEPERFNQIAGDFFSEGEDMHKATG